MKVILYVQADKHAKYCEAKESAGKNRTDPMYRSVRSPSEPKHGNDHSPSGNDTKFEPLFWFRRCRMNFGGVPLETRLNNGEEAEFINDDLV